MDHNSGLHDTPRELVTDATENPPSVGFLSLEAPVDNMHQFVWGMNEVPTPSLEPVNEGEGTSASTQDMADFPPISAGRIRYGYVEYVSRDTPSRISLILSCYGGP